eukprot:COSAG02_NODE_42075_length_388_cov_0.743945_1_plen_88_part_01
MYVLSGLHHDHDIASNVARLRVDAVALQRVGAASGSLETPHGLLSWAWALRGGTFDRAASRSRNGPSVAWPTISFGAVLSITSGFFAG